MYRTNGACCAPCLESQLIVQFPAGLVLGTEDLGDVVVRRALRPMGFEVRWGLRVDEIELHHRVLAPPEVRAATHAAVERALDGLGVMCPHE